MCARRIDRPRRPAARGGSPRVEPLESRCLLATFTVNTVADDGPGSLRQAILSANAASGLDQIRFNIPGPGPHTIIPLTELPTITDSVDLDATSQPGYSGAPIVELNGSSPGVGGSGLTSSASGTTIRGLVINRFSQYGIALIDVDGATVAGNYLGTDATGGIDRGNGFGGIVAANSRNVTIGGATPADANIISGNDGEGVHLVNRVGLPSGIAVLGNSIGTDRTGTRAIPNNSNGVFVNASGVQVGGTGPGQGNTIAFNGQNGVQVGFWVFQTGVTSNSIRGNSIFGNIGLGIDLGGDGVTINDFRDPDPGPNLLQNFPVIDAAFPSGGGTAVEGSLNARPNSSFLVDFYLNDMTDPSGYGQGQRYIGTTSVTTDGTGSADFSLSLPVAAAPGQVITATATDAGGNTSEFSLDTPVTSSPIADLRLSLFDFPDPVAVGQELTYRVFVTNDGPTRARGVTVTDALPEGVTFVSASPSQGTAALVDGVLTVGLGDLRVGRSATIDIVVRPTQVGSLTNTVAVRSDATDLDPDNNTASVTTNVTPALPADLAVFKASLPDPIQVDKELTYRIYVGNNGPGDAGGVTVTDELPQGVAFVSATSSQGTVVQSGGTITADLGRVLAGQTVQVTVVVRPLAIGTLTNTARVSGDQPDFNPANDISTDQTQVVTEANPPILVAQRLTTTRTGITGIVLTFSEALDPNLADAPENYALRSAGRDGRVGTADDATVALSSIRYDASRRTVTLTPARPLRIGVFYEITVNGEGAPGVTDTAGNVLDGDRNGLPDGIYESTIGRGTADRPRRFQRDQLVPIPANAPRTPHRPRPSFAALSETVLNLTRIKRREGRS